MKPQVIYLIRHGESHGNVNQSIYKSVPDWKIELTKKGHEQAREAAQALYIDIESAKNGHHLSNVFSNEHRDLPTIFYTSPWVRARQTTEHLNKHFQMKVYEDPRLREQEWGNYAEDQFIKKIARERKKFGSFFYRMPYGESGADVYDRVTSFLDTLYRDFAKDDYPLTAVIVSHGLTIKSFIMRWFHESAEDFDAYKTPRNCELIKMVLKSDNKYTLVTPLRKRKGKSCQD